MTRYLVSMPLPAFVVHWRYETALPIGSEISIDDTPDAVDAMHAAYACGEDLLGQVSGRWLKMDGSALDVWIGAEDLRTRASTEAYRELRLGEIRSDIANGN